MDYDRVNLLQYKGDGAYRPGLPTIDMDRSFIEQHAAANKRSVESVIDEATGSGLYEAHFAEGDLDAQEQSYADLQARAKALGIAANQKREALEAAIAEAEATAAAGDGSGGTEETDPGTGAEDGSESGGEAGETGGEAAGETGGGAGE